MGIRFVTKSLLCFTDIQVSAFSGNFGGSLIQNMKKYRARICKAGEGFLTSRAAEIFAEVYTALFKKFCAQTGANCSLQVSKWVGK